MSRYKVETRRNQVPTGKYFTDEEGNLHEVMTETYSIIELVDTKKVYKPAEFKEIDFAIKCAEALNKVEG